VVDSSLLPDLSSPCQDMVIQEQEEEEEEDPDIREGQDAQGD
jgi:hypothetical protein